MNKLFFYIYNQQLDLNSGLLLHKDDFHLFPSKNKLISYYNSFPIDQWEARYSNYKFVYTIKLTQQNVYDFQPENFNSYITKKSSSLKDFIRKYKLSFI